MALFNSDFFTEMLKQFGAIAKELSQEVKFVGLGIFILMNYWFIAIFLLANDFYINNFWVAIDISFILSITWFLINVLLSAIYFIIMHRNTNTQLLPDKMLILISGMISVISFSLILYISYCLELTFSCLLIVCICYSCGIFVLLVFLYILTKKLLKKNKQLS